MVVRKVVYPISASLKSIMEQASYFIPLIIDNQRIALSLTHGNDSSN